MTFLCVTNFLIFLETILYTSLKCYIHDDDAVNPDRFTSSCIQRVRAISMLWNYSFFNSFTEFIYYMFFFFSLSNWMSPWFNCSFYFLKDMIFQNLCFTVSKLTGFVFPLLQNFTAFLLFFIGIQSSAHAVSFTRYVSSSIFSSVRLGYRFS